MLVKEAALQLGHEEAPEAPQGRRTWGENTGGLQEAPGTGPPCRPLGRGRPGPLLAASTSFSTRPPLASVSTDNQSLTRKKVLRALCRSRTMTCCRNQAGLSPEGRGRGVRRKGAGGVPAGWPQAPPQTFVVVPHVDLAHAAQAVRGGDLEHVQAVAAEGSVPVQVPVAAAALRPVQHDAHMRRGTWRAGGHAHQTCEPGTPSFAQQLRAVPAPRG